MIMGNEDMTYAGHRQTHSLHLSLSSFPTVYHVVFTSDIYNLGGGHMPECWLC